MNNKHQYNLQKWYKLEDKGTPKVKEEILRRIKVKIDKINRYQQKLSQFQQNRFFRNNEGWFYKQIDGSEEGEEMIIPDVQETKRFWTVILGQ